MILFGAGGHAKVIAEILEKEKEGVDLVFDDDLSKKTLLGYKVEGKYVAAAMPEKKLIIGIGDNKLRAKIAGEVSHIFGNVISNDASVSEYTEIGVGNAIFAKAVIQAGVKIGNHCIVNTGGQIDHDCTIGDFSHIGPGVILCGGVAIGNHSLIGAGAVIIPGVRVGDNVTIGAGTIVVSDLDDNRTYVGNPAREVSKII